MANLDRPKGFVIYGDVKHLGLYQSGSEVFPGDAVVLAGDGRIDTAAAGDGTQLLGIAANYASAADVDVMVYDDPDQEFSIQMDESEFNVQDDIGESCNIVATAGNATYKHSRHEADSSDIAVTATAQLRIQRLEKSAKNAFGAQAEAVVRINQHELVDGAPV